MRTLSAIETAFAARGVTVEQHQGQTNIIFPNENKYTKCTVVCRVDGIARVCIIEDFEEALTDALDDAEIEYTIVDAKNFKIRQKRVLLHGVDVQPERLAASVCQAARTWYETRTMESLRRCRPSSAARVEASSPIGGAAPKRSNEALLVTPTKPKKSRNQ